MFEVDDEILQRMARAIVDEVDPEQIILFGSRARGDAREDSDVDLIVIEAESFGEDRSQFSEDHVRAQSDPRVSCAQGHLGVQP